MIETTRHHIGIKIIGLLLTFALLLPSAIRLSHAFTHHKHEVCHGENQSHLHTLDVDCKFYKFQLSSSFTLPNIEGIEVLVTQHSETPIADYFFLYGHPSNPYQLRGPPFLI